MAGRFSVEAVFKAVDRITAPVRRMQDRIQRFTDRAKRSLQDLDTVSDRVVTGFRNVGVAAAAAGAIVGAAFAEVIRVGAEFERTMMSAVAKFGGISRGTEEFEALRQAAEEVGATTEFDAQQAAGALDVYAAAGFSAQQAIASLAGAGDLATVSGLSLDQAASTAADSLSALGLSTEDAAQQARNLTRVNDVLARTSSMVNTSVTDMAEAIKAGGNITVQSGQSVETFGALVAAMARSNIKGAEAGTAIRNVLLRLQAPAARGQRALRSLGVSVRDSDGNMRDMVDVIGELSTAMAGMGTAQKNQLLSQIFGAETIGPALALLDAGAAGLTNFRDRLNQAEGAAADMAATLRDTTMGDIDGFSSAIDGVKTAIFGVVSGPFRELLRGLTEWVNRNREVVTSGVQEFLTWLVDNLPEIAKWGRRIAVVAGVFLSVATAIKAASAAMAVLNFLVAMNPIGLLVMAITAAVALIIAFWPEISAFFSDIWERAKDVALRVGAWFGRMWTGVKSAFESVVGAVGGFLEGVWGPVRDFLAATFEFIVGLIRLAFEPARMYLQPYFDMIVSGVQLIRDHWGPISAFFRMLWDGVVTHYSAKWEQIVSVARVVGGILQFLWDGFVVYAQTKWNQIVEAATFAFDLLKAVWEPITGFFSFLWDSIVADFTSKFEQITGAVGWVVDTVRGVGRETLGTEEGAGAPRPQVVSPEAGVSRSIEERTSTNRSEVVIRDQTGRAEMPRRQRGGANIRLEPSGAF